MTVKSCSVRLSTLKTSSHASTSEISECSNKFQLRRDSVLHSCIKESSFIREYDE